MIWCRARRGGTGRARARARRRWRATPSQVRAPEGGGGRCACVPRRPPAHCDPTPRAPQTIWAGGLPLTGASSSQTAGNPACPAGYAVIDVDLNRGAGGTYSYLCVQRGDGGGAGALLLNLSVAVGSAAAPPVCSEAIPNPSPHRQS